MNKKYYLPFEKFVLRTPLFPVSSLENLEFKDSPIFDEALYLASPELYEEKQKSYKETGRSDHQKMQLSLHKYYSRACTRCTPFGLFAGCSVGSIDGKTEIVLDDLVNFKRCTRLDMEYLFALIQSLEQKDNIRSQIRYYPNDSIYEIGGKLRYIEYYFKGTNRVDQLVSIENSEYISEILKLAQNGATVSQLVSQIGWEDFSPEEISGFIMELINSQLLKSELEIKITGENPLSALIAHLTKLQGIEEVIDVLKKIQNLLLSID